MALNLHGIVRGPINAVNPDVSGTWRSSSGSTTAADGSRTPTFTDFVGTLFQVQPLTWRDLQHRDMQNIQGIARSVYMFGNSVGVSRPDVKGGDLLVFPQVRGGAPQTWLVVAVLESWAPDVAGWCKLGVILQ
jgi:hypothetical protein